ncbi:MAG TPA: membrane dipeptidase [Anaerolineales bacterium]|jgi:membrane dipeptidase
MLIIDAHEDLAWNILTFGRDYTLSAREIRQRERDGEAPLHNGDTLLGWPEYQRGRVAVVFATLFAAPIRRRMGEWDTQFYKDSLSAHTIYSRQLDEYYRLVDNHPDKFRLILTLQDFLDVVDRWERSTGEEQIPVGLVLLMEGAEAVRDPGELVEWWERGVRIIGPAWAGNRFCGGTREPGPLTPEGYALLDGMSDLDLILDTSHMDEEAVLQATDYYPGPIIASHSNAAALLKRVESNRFFSDRQIQGLIERDGIIGIVPYNRFLDYQWTPKDGRHAITLHHVVAQIDYICQMAGDARHVGLGTDFDGGFGVQYTPAEVDTIADLQKLIPLLEQRGYTVDDVAAILGENWLSLLRRTLPETT